MSRMGCVIQGDIRQGFKYVLDVILRHFDQIILSTWKSEESKVPAGRFELILNDCPQNPGVTNRSLQRITTMTGVKCARSLGCEYLLKWRTDMLPTALDCNELLRAADYNVPDDVPSRLVMSAFRNLSVDPDWFSSFPDLYAFGHIEMMELLWSHGRFDFSLPFNIPPAMLECRGIEMTTEHKILLDGQDVTDNYDAHSEFYAFFKDGLQAYLKRKITHPEIARDYLYLSNHENLKICWFRPGRKLKFRSIGQAWTTPWLTEEVWRTGELPCPVKIRQPHGFRRKPLQGVYDCFRIHREMWLGRCWLKSYMRSRHDDEK